MRERESRSARRGPLAELQTAIAELVDEVSERVFGFAFRAGFPRHELRVEDDAYRVLVEVPGVLRDDIDVTVSGQTLFISGERREFTLPDGAERLRAERPFGRFQRSVELPGAIDEMGVVAELDHGVLDIHLPKRSARRGRGIDIEIRSGTAPTGSASGAGGGERDSPDVRGKEEEDGVANGEGRAEEEEWRGPGAV